MILILTLERDAALHGVHHICQLLRQLLLRVHHELF
jgi:hypothetical protein